MFRLLPENSIVQQGKVTADIRDEEGIFTCHGAGQRIQIAFDLYLAEFSEKPIGHNNLGSIRVIQHVYFGLRLEHEHSLIGRAAWATYIRYRQLGLFDYDGLQAYLHNKYHYGKTWNGQLVWPLKIVLGSRHFRWGYNIPVLTAYVSDAIESNTISLGRDLLGIGNLTVDNNRTCFFPKRT